MSIDREATRRRERAFRSFAQAAQEALGERIHKTILYGSVARGEATEQSDVDVLIVLDENDTEGEARDILSELAFDIGLEYDVAITHHIQTRERFVSRQEYPFLQNVLSEGRSYG